MASKTRAGAEPTRAGAELLWGVGAVAIRLGIATPTLRTWERRYGIGPSRRTSGGHRRYNEDDIERVELMKRLVAEGVPAEAAAAVATSMEHLDLEAALTAPEPHTSSVRDTHPPSAVAPVMVASIVRAAVDLDARSLDTCYD